MATSGIPSHTPEEYLANEYWLRKIKTGFKVYDANRNGKVSLEDMVLVAKRFGEKQPSRADEILKEYTTIFLYTCGGSDAALTLQQWIDTRAEFSSKPDAPDKFRAYTAKKFSIVDANQDGIISREEFRDYFECQGIDTKFADAAFDALDTNKDGVISQDEFSDAGVEYHFGFDPDHPSRLFYGPLAD